MTSPEPQPVSPSDAVEDDLLIERLDPRDHPEFARPARPAPGPDDSYDGDQQDLADRQLLRRVAGMSTELTDITEVEYRQLLLERVVLVSVWTTGTAADAENSLAELKLLAETAGSQVLEGLVQR